MVRPPEGLRFIVAKKAGVAPEQSEWPSVFRVIKHEVIPLCGSYEVRFADGRVSRFFYYDNVLARRLRPGILTIEQAFEQAKALARAERKT